MALIICPECKKEISNYANVCPHCGYPIGKFNSQSLSSKELNGPEGDGVEQLQPVVAAECPPSKNTYNKKLIMLGGVVVLIALIFVFFFIQSQQYSYERDGLWGVQGKIHLEDERGALYNIDCDEIEEGTNYTNYVNSTFIEEYQGNLWIDWDEEENRIKEVHFSIPETKREDVITLVDTISNKLTKPTHIENINDQTKYIYYWLWEYGKNNCLSLEYYAKYNTAYIIWGSIDEDARNSFQNRQKEIQNDSQLSEDYDNILQRAAFQGHSIQEAISQYNLTEYKTSDDSMYYIEHGELFGHLGEYRYHCDSPYSNYPPDFIGEIKYVTFNWDTDDLAQQELRDILQKLSGEDAEESELTGLHFDNGMPYKISIHTSNTSLSLQFLKNDQYYLLDPSFDFDDSDKYIAPYTDCDPEILHISKYTEEEERLYLLISNGILRLKDSLKDPDSLSIRGITRSTTSDTVYFYYSAKNGFGGVVSSYCMYNIEGLYAPGSSSSTEQSLLSTLYKTGKEVPLSDFKEFLEDLNN